MELQYGVDGVPFLMWGDNLIQLELKLDEDAPCREKAANELRETPDVVENSLNELRRLLKSELILVLLIDFYNVFEELISTQYITKFGIVRHLFARYDGPTFTLFLLRLFRFVKCNYEQ